MLDIANYAFVIIFTIEAALKLYGMGVRYYFFSDWNKFDFTILILCYLTLIETDLLFFKASILRALRIVRLFRMIKVLKGIRKMFKSLKASIPSLINVGALLLLLYFVFGIAGMSLFG